MSEATTIDVSTESASVPADGATVASETETPVATTAEELAAAQTPIEPDAPRDEAERLEPDPSGPVTLSFGMEVDIVPLKLRETMKLLKIVTRGAGGALEQIVGDFNMDDPVVFAQTLGALILMSLPEADQQVVEFLQIMVVPSGFAELPQAERLEKINTLYAELNNPSLDDTISIVERIVRRESEDIRNLGKRLTTAFGMLRRVGELPAAN